VTSRGLKLLASVGLCLVAGAVGSLFTAPAIATWYAGLHKPFFNPPNWLFAPVWTTLFGLMGISLYLILVAPTKKISKVQQVKLFLSQLGLNILWSGIFFGLQDPFIAFIEVVGFWSAIAATLISFKTVSQKAAWLLAPYLAWVSFAAILNLAIVHLNP
jgi:translocator protein